MKRIARFVRVHTLVRETLSHPMLEAQDVPPVWHQQIATLPEFDPMKEHAYVLLLNSRHRITAISHISTGSLTVSIVHPREVFRPVIVGAARYFVLCHNHPSGDPSPSEDDRRLTRLLEQGAKVLDIGFADHVIIGDPANKPAFFSFRESGLLC